MNKLIKSKSGSKIEWTEDTWNPVVGCHKISKGCLNCYAEKMHIRHHANPKQPKYIKPFNQVVCWDDEILKPFDWKKPKLIFVCSMSDLFNKDVPDEFIKKVFETMNKTHHQYQVLTKRSDRLKKLAPKLKWTPNIWAGVSVESAKHISRIDDLKYVPAQIKYLSVEPMIGDLDNVELTGIDWVIAGGESGNSFKKLRPIQKDWVIKLKDKCVEESIPLFFKQWGREEFNPDPNDPTIPSKEDKNIDHKPKGGHLIDGVKYSELPEFIEYWGVDIVPNIKSKIEELDKTIHRSIKAFSRSWIDLGKSLALIKEKIDELGSGKRYWKTYLDVESFQDYCKKRLRFSREAATQMRQAFTIIKSTKPELLEGDTAKIPSYTMVRALGPHIDKIISNPENYTDLIDTAYDLSTTREDLNKAIRTVFPKPVKTVKSEPVQTNIFDWSGYLEEVEEKISFELKEYQQSKLRGLMSEIRELLKLV